MKYKIMISESLLGFVLISANRIKQASEPAATTQYSVTLLIHYKLILESTLLTF